MDENPYQSPKGGGETPPTSEASATPKSLRFREVFVITSALMFMSMMLLPLFAVENATLTSIRTAYDRAQRQDELLGSAILASLAWGFVCACFGKVRTAFTRGAKADAGARIE